MFNDDEGTQKSCIFTHKNILYKVFVVLHSALVKQIKKKFIGSKSIIRWNGFLLLLLVGWLIYWKYPQLIPSWLSDVALLDSLWDADTSEHWWSKAAVINRIAH